MVAMAAALAVAATSDALWAQSAAFTAALALGLPLLVADNPRVAARVLAVACIAGLALTVSVTWMRATDEHREPALRWHDGGVLVTRAAAEEIRHGRNPYRTDYTDVLPADWQEVQGIDGAHVANPVRFHFPYLPAAALVQVPFVVVGDALGWGWDTRWIGGAALVGAVVALARRREPAWARLGAVLGLVSVLTVLNLAWGTNDVFTAALAILAVCAIRRAPLAGVLLALAVSAKVLLVVLVVPLALWVWLDGGWPALRRWWTFPAVMAATCLPYLIADPSSFLDDTVWFNLGRSSTNMPTSGIGIPAVHPGFGGPALAAVTALGLVAALVGPAWAVRRWPSPWVATAASGVALLAVLLPARTFQANYLVIVAALVSTVWLAVVSRDGRETQAT
jgi:hypothetical protein